MSNLEPGKIDKAVGIIKGLSLQNVAVIAMLLLMAIPAYLTWKIINDEALLNMLFSSYAERQLAGTDCSMRVASVRGGRSTYNISMSYGFSGNDRWYLGVTTPVEPNDTDAKNYCRVLDEIIDYARDPVANPSPTFPYSQRQVFPTLLQRP